MKQKTNKFNVGQIVTVSPTAETPSLKKSHDESPLHAAIFATLGEGRVIVAWIHFPHENLHVFRDIIITTPAWRYVLTPDLMVTTHEKYLSAVLNPLTGKPEALPTELVTAMPLLRCWHLYDDNRIVFHVRSFCERSETYTRSDTICHPGDPVWVGRGDKAALFAQCYSD